LPSECDPLWLSESEIKAMHSDLITQYGGGSAGILNEGLISASLARPRYLLIYKAPSLFDLAASYGYGLTKNHGFVDGNKRVAFVAMATFLELNGYSLGAPEREAAMMMERLSTGRESEDSIAEWLEANSVKH